MTEANESNVSVGKQERGAGQTWLRVGIGLGVVGLVGWLARWLIQGEGVIYTDIARAFWVPDATLGWVETSQRWVWLGADGLALTAGVVLGTGAMAFLSKRLGSPKLRSGARVLALVGAGVSLLAPALPGWAFISGMPPAEARRLMPEAQPAPVAKQGEVAPAQPALTVPGGRWKVVESKASLLVARISAGGETFDAKFTPLLGEATLDPAKLDAATARFAAPSGSIDTGVELRNGHAKGYLKAEEHAEIALTVSALSVSAGASDAARAFQSKGELALMGGRIEVAVSGTLAVLDAAQKQELGVTAKDALLVQASFTLPIAKTTLDRKNFDSDEITLNVRFAMAPAP